MRLKNFHEPVRLKKISQFFLKYFPGYQQKLYINVNFLCPCFRLIFFKLYKSDCYLEWTCNCHTLCAYLDLCVYLFFEKCWPWAFIMPTCLLGTREYEYTIECKISSTFIWDRFQVWNRDNDNSWCIDFTDCTWPASGLRRETTGLK